MKRQFYLLLAIILVGCWSVTQAQNTFPPTGAAGIGTTTPASSAALEIKSTNQGLLIPRMSKNQRDLISSPVTGLLIYQNDNTPGFYYYTGSAWKAISSTSTAGASKNLSNLTAPTAVNVSLLPGDSGIIDVGSVSKPWKSGYFSGGLTVTAGSILSMGGLATAVSGKSAAARSYGVYGFNSAGTGVYGNSTSSTGYGVYGTNSAGTAIYGTSTASSGTGVYGYCSSGYGVLGSGKYGVYAVGDSIGVTATSNNGKGVYGTTNSGYGVYGNSSSAGTGVYGASIDGRGVYGFSNNSNGVFGKSMSKYTAGVYGYNSVGTGVSGTSNYGDGVHGLSTYGTGVYGETIGDQGIGVEGFNFDGTNTVGVKGDVNDGTGVHGEAYYGIGVHGISYSDSGYGVYGQGKGERGSGVYGVGGYLGIGVYGSAMETTGLGVFGQSKNGDAIYGHSINYRGGFFASDYNDALTAVTSATGHYAGVFNGNVYTTGTYITSDKNLKKNIQDFKSAISIINKLKPKYYEFKDDEQYNFLHLPKGKHYGFLAQDIEEVLPDLIKQSWQKDDNRFSKRIQSTDGTPTADTALIAEDKSALTGDSVSVKAVNYTELIPIIIKGMQEQQAQLEALRKQNNALQQQNAGLQKQFNELTALVSQIRQNQEKCNPCNAVNAHDNTGTSTHHTAVATGRELLLQNVPNPFSNTTAIRYTLPAQYTNALLLITNKEGKNLKTIALPGNGSGVIQIDAASLAAGVYQYSLLINNKIVATKQMILTK